MPQQVQKIKVRLLATPRNIYNINASPVLRSNMTDTWAQADAARTAATQATTPAASAAAPSSNIVPPAATSQIFGSGGGAGPSIFNKTHPLGTERTGIITKEPYDRQSTNNKREPKFWQQGERAPVTDAVNPNTGEPNRPVMDTVFELDTDYTMDAQEAGAINREVPFEGGRRSFTVGGDDLKVTIEAMHAYNAANPNNPITGAPGQGFTGKRITIKRASQKPTQGGKGTPAWVLEVSITQA